MAGLMAAAPAQAASAAPVMSGTSWFAGRLGDAWPGTAHFSDPVSASATSLNVNNSTSLSRVSPSPGADAGVANVDVPTVQDAAPVTNAEGPTYDSTAKQMSWGDTLEPRLTDAEISKVSENDMKWGADDEKALQFSKLDKEMAAAKESFNEMTPKQQESVMKLLNEKGGKEASKTSGFDTKVRNHFMENLSKDVLKNMTTKEKRAYQNYWLKFYSSDF